MSEQSVVDALKAEIEALDVEIERLRNLREQKWHELNEPISKRHPSHALKDLSTKI